MMKNSELFGFTKLSNNWIFGYFQLCRWIFLNPSGWRAFVMNIDPELSPAFSLLELKPRHWQNPEIKRLLFYVFLVSPLISAIISGIIGNLLGYYLGGVGLRSGWFLFCVSYAFFSTLVIGLMHGLVIGIGYGIFISIWMGIPDQIGGIMWGVWGAAGVPGFLTIIYSNSQFKNYGSLKRNFGAIFLALSFVAMLIYIASSSIQGTKIGQGIGPNTWLIALIGGTLYGITYTIIAIIRYRKKVLSLRLGISFFALGTFAYYFALTKDNTGDILLVVSAGIAGSLLFGGLFCLGYAIAKNMGGSTIGAIIGSTASGIAWVPIYPYLTSHDVPAKFLNTSTNFTIGFIVVFLGLTSIYWRPILTYFPALIWNRIILSIQRSSSDCTVLLWNCAFWDEFYYMPLLKLYGLDTHLILVTQKDKNFARLAFEYLSVGNQRWAAQSALQEIIILDLQNCQDIIGISQIHLSLLDSSDNVASPFFWSFHRISFDVMSALDQSSALYKRQAFVRIRESLQLLSQKLILSKDNLAIRFVPIVSHWLEIVLNYISGLEHEISISQELDNPYIVALPLKNQSVFVGREEAVQRIQNLLLDRRRPPLFIYGQKRMGKTSLLFNLGRLLPISIVPLFVDGQGLAGSKDYGEFLYCFARQVVRSVKEYRNIQLNTPQMTSFVHHPIGSFQNWLDDLEDVLKQEHCDMALLILDELEAITNTLDHLGNNEFLHLLPHLIQHKPYFKLLLASSYPLNTFQKLAGYLINTQTIKVGYLNRENAERLIVSPVSDFGLLYENEAKEFILSATRCHPFLIQALCSELVLLKNRQAVSDGRRLATLADVQAALEYTLIGSHFYFTELEELANSQSIPLLRVLAKRGPGEIITIEEINKICSEPEKVLDRLTQLDILEQANGSYRFQIEVHRKWFERSS